MMAEQKKKNKPTDLTDNSDEEREYLLNLRNIRLKRAQNGKAIKTKRTYHAETLGMPPLRMVLVHAKNDRANAALKPVNKTKSKITLTQEEAVMKIIEHLTKSK
jgi:hypothetical protein